MIFLQVFLNLAIFLPLSLVTFYLPGFWLVKKTKDKLEDQEILALSFSLSLIFFLLMAAVFGLISLRAITLPVVILVGVLVILKYKKSILAPWKIFLEDKLLSVLVILGILTMGFINFPNGLNSSIGLQFWSSQGYDGTWHIALMEEVKRSFPLQSPIFAGEKLVNYHYLGDVVMGEFYRIFPFFSSWDLYFRLFPIIFSFMIIISVYALLTRWQQSKIAGYLGIFFTVFVGSFGFIVTLVRSGNLFGGETAFWSSQLNTIISNPPHAIALSLLSTFFLALYFFEKGQVKFWLVVLLLLAGFISGFKVSAGVGLLAGLGVATILTLSFDRKYLFRLVLLVVLGILNVGTFLSITKSGSNLLIFEPWWFIRTLIVSKLGWVDLELKRQTYIAESNWKRVLQIELTGFFLYLVGNSGTRIIGFIAIVGGLLKVKKYYRNFFEVTILSTMIVAFAIPLLFLQKGVPANIIQFMQYFLLILGFYAAIASYKILLSLKNKVFQAAFLILLVLLSVPTVIGNFNEFYGGGKNATSIISRAEFDALSYLRANSALDSVILTAPFDKNLKNKFPNLPSPVYAWYPTPYVSAVSQRRTYLSAEEMLDQTGYPYKERVENENKFFQQKDIAWSKEFLKRENISFIYLHKDEIRKPLIMKELELIYENQQVEIFRVKT